jgi:hypothetical protein
MNHFQCLLSNTLIPLLRTGVVVSVFAVLPVWAASPPTAASQLSPALPANSTAVSLPPGVVTNRPVGPPRMMPVPNPIGIRSVSPLGGQQISILFNAVPNATTYTLRRGPSPTGPITPLPQTQVSLSTNNYVVNPPCCEIIDRAAYTVGVGQTVYYVIDAWAGPNLILSSTPVRMDLPIWFAGPLNVDLEKTGSNQWTIGWEPVQTATNYLVWVQLGDGPINIYYNSQIPPGQNQLTLGGLQSGSRYHLIVEGIVPWNGTKASRDGSMYYTAP